MNLLSPVSVVGKLFQDTWCRGLAWDELLPSDLGALWNTWVSTLPHLAHLRVPRWVGIVDRSNPQVHVFCDTSERAYGAILYIRYCTVDNNVVHLACSKNRLALVKVTLPRLEILAALVGARLLRYFCQATCIDITEATLGTDSTVALGWIRQDPNRWKTFVFKRVTEIFLYDPLTMATLSRVGKSSWRAFKRSNCRTVENHGHLVAWAFLARATFAALAPEHTRSRRFPSRRERIRQSHPVC